MFKIGTHFPHDVFTLPPPSADTRSTPDQGQLVAVQLASGYWEIMKVVDGAAGWLHPTAIEVVIGMDMATAVTHFTTLWVPLTAEYSRFIPKEGETIRVRDLQHDRWVERVFVKLSDDGERALCEVPIDGVSSLANWIVWERIVDDVVHDEVPSSGEEDAGDDLSTFEGAVTALNALHLLVAVQFHGDDGVSHVIRKDMWGDNNAKEAVKAVLDQSRARATALAKLTPADRAALGL